MKARAAIPDLPVFLNSPMAIDMTDIYHRHRAEHRPSIEECSGLCHVAKMVRSVEESRALVAQRHPVIIILARGMATGGRVLHHLKPLAPDRRNTIVFAGFQAGGTRGVYLNHSEPGPADALRQRIERELGWSVTVPRLGPIIGIQP